MADDNVKKSGKIARRKAKIQEIQSEKLQAQLSKVNSGQLELLVSIVPSNKAEFYTDLLQSSFEVNFQCTALAHGTANAELLSLSDWSDQSKTAIFSVIQKDKANDALRALEDRFAKIKKGKGIAFTIPFSSVIGVATYAFLSNNIKAIKEENNG